MLVRQPRKHLKPRSVGADKGYHSQWFIDQLRSRGVRPHVACIEGRQSEGLDGRTLNSGASRASRIVRKRIEQFFGAGKTVAGLRKTRLRGVQRTAQLLYITATAYNLLRISRLRPATGSVPLRSADEHRGTANRTGLTPPGGAQGQEGADRSR